MFCENFPIGELRLLAGTQAGIIPAQEIGGRCLGPSGTRCLRTDAAFL